MITNFNKHPIYFLDEQCQSKYQKVRINFNEHPTYFLGWNIQKIYIKCKSKQNNSKIKKKQKILFCTVRRRTVWKFSKHILLNEALFWQTKAFTI